jgi:hypothetical protein
MNFEAAGSKIRSGFVKIYETFAVAFQLPNNGGIIRFDF